MPGKDGTGPLGMGPCGKAVMYAAKDGMIPPGAKTRKSVRIQETGSLITGSG